jgi:hypothetical protein
VAMIDDGGHVSERDLIPAGQREANAHLIAAAPDLLEAVRAARKAMEQLVDTDSEWLVRDAIDQCDAAFYLAKKGAH